MQRTVLLLFVLTGLCLASCKKTYTCNCVTTDNSGGIITEYKNTSTTYSEKMTNKQAKSACKHEEEAVNSSYENFWSNNGTVKDPNFSTTTTCALN